MKSHWEWWRQDHEFSRSDLGLHCVFQRDKHLSVNTTSQAEEGFDRDGDRLREQLVILAAECPYTNSNPPSCPLHEVRKLEPTAIIDWLDALNPDEKDFLTTYHQVCLETKRESDRVVGSQPKEDSATAKRKRPKPRKAPN